MLYFNAVEKSIMNFQIYLDEELGQQIHHLCHSTHKKRNTIIREALKLYLDTQKKSVWPDSILTFNGVSDFPAFETDRKIDLFNTRPEFLD